MALGERLTIGRRDAVQQDDQQLVAGLRALEHRRRRGHGGKRLHRRDARLLDILPADPVLVTLREEAVLARGTLALLAQVDELLDGAAARRALGSGEDVRLRVEQAGKIIGHCARFAATVLEEGQVLLCPRTELCRAEDGIKKKRHVAVRARHPAQEPQRAALVVAERRVLPRAWHTSRAREGARWRERGMRDCGKLVRARTCTCAPRRWRFNLLRRKSRKLSIALRTSRGTGVSVYDRPISSSASTSSKGSKDSHSSACSGQISNSSHASPSASAI